MNSIQNRLDLIIFVFSKGRLTNDDVTFFKLVQNDIFRNESKKNSLLLVTGCEKGWVAKQKSRELADAIENCGGKYFEFNLIFDKEEQPAKFHLENRKNRQKAINELVDCMGGFFRESDMINEKIKELERILKQREEERLKSGKKK